MIGFNVLANKKQNLADREYINLARTSKANNITHVSYIIPC